MDVNERARRYRARKRGENVPKLSPGVKRGYKQTQKHIEKRKRFGPEHYAWKGDSANIKTGRTRAERKFNKKPCEKCGITTGLIERHHKDGDTLNNEPENIEFVCRRCHMQKDGRLEKFSELGKRMWKKALIARWN